MEKAFYHEIINYLPDNPLIIPSTTVRLTTRVSRILGISIREKETQASPQMRNKFISHGRSASSMETV